MCTQGLKHAKIGTDRGKVIFFFLFFKWQSQSSLLSTVASENIASPTFSFSLNTLKDIFKPKLADLQSHNFLFSVMTMTLFKLLGMLFVISDGYELF